MTTLRFSRSPHLVGLVAEAERLAERLAEVAAPADHDALEPLRADAAVASLRLDGSPIEEPPAPADIEARPASEPETAAPPVARSGSWYDALTRRLGEAPDAEILAIEYAGVRAAIAADDLAESLLTEPVSTLSELHRRLTRGLLGAEHAGEPRQSDQAVQDASVGRIIYFPAAPADIPTRLNLLGAWLETTGAREHGLVASGVLHFELLAIHPYEAANGRLSRAAARLALRARGLDPRGAGLVEATLAHDPIGYYEEVAKTLRRRDLTIWLERWGEAVVAGLRDALDRLGTAPPEVSERPAAFLRDWDETRFTIADYRASAGVGPEDARADLLDLLDARRVRRVPGSRGLRYELTDP